jgi:Flp pilus assembly protein TadD
MVRKGLILSGVVSVVLLALNLAGCAQTGNLQPGSAQKGARQESTYQQSQKMIWVDPQGSGANTDMQLYLDSQGAGP